MESGLLRLRLIALLGAPLLAVACAATQDSHLEPSPNAGAHGPVVIHQSFSPSLVVREISLVVGQELLVTGSNICTGSPPNQRCQVLLIPLASADNNVLQATPSIGTYQGLSAQQFVAFAAGHTALVPAGPCPKTACPEAAIFPEHLAVTVSG